MRRGSPRTRDRDAIRLTLAYRPPLAWDALIGFLSGRATAGVEWVEGGAYFRTAVVGTHRGWLKVEPIAGRHALGVELATSLTPALPEILARLKNLFDLGARPDLIAAHLRSDPRIAWAVDRCPGLRVPGAFDGFELAVRAILGQRVSVLAATTLAGRLAARFGEPIATPFPGLVRLSPAPERLADVEDQELTALGIGAAGDGGRELDLQPSPDPETLASTLQEYPGLGDWTAQYIAMRALRWPDAFPAGDLGLLRAAGEPSASRLRVAAEAWRPWRAYAAMYLWTSNSHQRTGDCS
jgi:AraC family transcriptional regulator of adaptative response / DNA-3-methyladenine glycosylase II